MRASSKRALSIGLSAIFFLATLVVYGSLIKPEMKVVDEKRAALATSEELFAEQKVATDQVKKSLSTLKSSTHAREALDIAVPVGPNMTQALHQISAVVQNSRVSIESLTITQGTPEASKQTLIKRLGKLELNFSVSGSYESVKSFLRTLETNVRITNVKQFDFLSGLSEKGSATGIFTLQVVGEMYYQEN